MAHESIMIAPYPEPNRDLLDDQAETDLSTLMDVVRAIRNVRAEMRVPQKETVRAIIASQDASPLLNNERTAIETLARAAPTIRNTEGESPNGDNLVTIVLPRATVAVSLAHVIDVEEARARLEADLASVSDARTRLEQRLSNHDFLAKAPDEVVDRERARLAEADDRIDRLRQLVGTGE